MLAYAGILLGVSLKPARYIANVHVHNVQCGCVPAPFNNRVLFSPLLYTANAGHPTLF
jgi:hypothetical protein